MQKNKNANTLRETQTDAEQLLWQKLRNRHLGGYKFRRQVPIDRYIVDFVCLEKRLVIEVDGSQHFEHEIYDTNRTAHLQNSKYTVVRYWNNDVMRDTEAVLEDIFNRLEKMD